MTREPESSKATGLSEERFEELYQDYYPLVFALCRSRLGSREEALDAAQEVFLRKWRARGTYDPTRASFRTWVSRNTEHLCTDLYRRSAVRPALEEFSDEVVAGEVDPTDGRSAERVAVNRALSNLTAQQRQLVLMHEVDGYTWEEIAHQTGLTVAQARGAVARAIELLRELLSEQGVAPAG